MRFSATVRALGRNIRLADLPRSRLVRDFAQVTLLRACQVGFGIVTTYFLARTLSKEEFGEYHFILNLVGLLTLFSLKEINNAVMQSVARGFLGTFRASLRYGLLGSAVAAVVLTGLAIWYLLRQQHQLGMGLAIAAALFLFTHGLTQWKGLKMGRGDFAGFTRYEGVGAIITHLAIVASILAVPQQYFLPLALLLGIPGLLNLLLTLRCLRQTPKTASVEGDSIRYGIRTSIYGALQIGAKHVDKLFLFVFLSPATLATYVAADRIADLLATAVQDLAAVLGPRFARRGRYSRKLDQVLKYTSWAVGAAYLVFAFTALPWLLTAIFSDRYADAVPYSQALICAIAIGNLANFRFRYIRSTLDEASVRHVMLITAGTRIAFAVILVPAFGILGAVAAAFAYRVSLALTVRYLIQRRYLGAASVRQEASSGT